jgi:hypothetical protein
MTTLTLSSLASLLGATHTYNPTTSSIEMAVGDLHVEVEAVPSNVTITAGATTVTLNADASLEEVAEAVAALLA